MTDDLGQGPVEGRPNGDRSDGPPPTSPPPLGGRVVRGGMWIFAARLASRLLGLVSLMILARALAPQDFGLMAIGLIVIETLELFSETGFEAALVQRKELAREYVDTAWTVSIGRGLVLGGLLALCAPLVASFFSDPEVVPLLRVMALSPVIKGFANSYVVSFARDLEFEKRFALLGGGAAIQALVAIAVALVVPSVWALVAGLLAGNLGRVALSFVLTRRRPRLVFSRERFRELFSFGRWILGSKIVVFLSTQGDDVVVGKLLGTDALGYYRVAYRISNLPATELAQVVSTAAFPAFAKLQDDLDRLRRAFLRTFELSTVMSFLFGGLILVFADVLVQLVLGDKWLAAVPLVRILSVYGIMRSMGASFGPVFKAIGRPDLGTRIQVFNLLVFAAAIFPMTLRWGLIGAAGAVVAASLASAPINFAYVMRMTGCPASGFVPTLIRAPVYGLISLGAAAAVRFLWLDGLAWPWLIVLATAASLLYGALWVITWRLGRSEMWDFVRDGIAGVLGGRQR
jgi:O-antigen/teichoic acid export membrane protein